MPATRTRRTTRRPRRQASKRSKVSKAVKTYVRKAMPKVEMKQTWAHANEIQLSTLSQGYTVSGPNLSQGLTSDTRVGNIVNMSGVHMKGALYNNSTSESFVRALIVGYDATNGDPSVNLFRNNSTGATAGFSSVNGLDAMYFPVNKVDLHVYWDKVFKLAGSATGNAGVNTKFFSKFVKMNGRKVEFKGNNWSYGSQNWMYSVIFIASDANDDTSTGTAVELSYLKREYYKDA